MKRKVFYGGIIVVGWIVAVATYLILVQKTLTPNLARNSTLILFSTVPTILAHWFIYRPLARIAALKLNRRIPWLSIYGAVVVCTFLVATVIVSHFIDNPMHAGPIKSSEASIYFSLLLFGFFSGTSEFLHYKKAEKLKLRQTEAQ